MRAILPILKCRDACPKPSILPPIESVWTSVQSERRQLLSELPPFENPPGLSPPPANSSSSGVCGDGARARQESRSPFCNHPPKRRLTRTIAPLPRSTIVPGSGTCVVSPFTSNAPGVNPRVCHDTPLSTDVAVGSLAPTLLRFHATASVGDPPIVTQYRWLLVRTG